MLSNDPQQSECLSLVASLYGAVSHPERFARLRATCEQWLSLQVASDTPAARFLRLQLTRAAEARALSARAAAEVPSACAVLTLDDRGRVVAAGAEAWSLLRSGSSGEDPLRVPGALRAFAEDAGLSHVVPRALRVPLDDGSAELAGVVLGVDQVRHAVGTMRVMTLLLCDVGAPPAETISRGPAEVREFRKRSLVPPAGVLATNLAAERPA
jgi:hypothetical protein